METNIDCNIPKASCPICESEDVKVETVEGKGLPPKGYVQRPMGRKISWKGLWDITTCNYCGEITRRLRK